MALSTVSVRDGFFMALYDDLLPAPTVSQFFGISPAATPLDRDVFGVWLGMWRKGLLTKASMLDALRTGAVEALFDEQIRKLAGRGHGYALRVLSLIHISEPTRPY